MLNRNELELKKLQTTTRAVHGDLLPKSLLLFPDFFLFGNNGETRVRDITGLDGRHHLRYEKVRAGFAKNQLYLICYLQILIYFNLTIHVGVNFTKNFVQFFSADFLLSGSLKLHCHIDFDYETASTYEPS